MADVQYLRPAPRGRSGRLSRPSKTRGRVRGGHGPGGARYVLLGAAVLVLAVIVVGGVVMATAKASLGTDATALARVSMPFGGGSIQSVDAVTGPHSTRVPVELRGDAIWPRRLVPAGERISLDVVVRRPGAISWLAGSTETLHLNVATPVARLRSQFLTVRGNRPLTLRFAAPVAVFAAGSPGQVRPHHLSTPTSVVTVPRTAAAGTLSVAAAPRTWELARAISVSWFPAGGAATAVANPAPGARIGASTPITLTFSKPVATVLGAHLPPLTPAQGSWHQLGPHAIVFRPSGYGYGLGAKIHLALPSGVRLVGGQQGTSASGGTWSVPGGSPVRLQQMLALLGYLPLKFHYSGAGVGLTAQDQLNAAMNPPSGRFSWQYANTPAALRGFWSPGSFGLMTRGALMAFENDHGIAADGVAGPIVWRTLIGAVLSGRHSSFGYTFVSVSTSSQTLTLWHNGQTVIAGTPVNTGIASAPTATGTYPVFEHLPVTTMSGTNPDGSHYHDPGIPDVSYFNGGDALHGFTRAQYGSPQSLGCVEMPYAMAARVYPYTPIGTLVHVA